jgi:hypothetical protein
MVEEDEEDLEELDDEVINKSKSLKQIHNNVYTTLIIAYYNLGVESEYLSDLS